MNTQAIGQAIKHRIGSNQILLGNGTPNHIQIGGSPRKYYELQQAIAAVQTLYPDSRLDISSACEYLRDRK
ncbi:MAG: hypothetical protein A3I68_02815 [Candidatus Melainabacteria bacterium RIFCSPLOWO2_02_FULL_35_15]|nr:MAG: hypothetical protein A3F80_02410 [Candidatus Melainabacteria bacterium RIFCSPLOWO2_12_FULL_35_11]OGI13061.1 MAG: hypothetical protein A3I68_02815 [Candidatus Melainabacteria bacterium RIFCSPLOWO2_02_FULL_35_15]